MVLVLFLLHVFIMPSAVIAHIDYDSEKKELIVVFLSGETYVYEQVPEKIYKEFRASISKGNYLNRKIKKLFKYKKLPR